MYLPAVFAHVSHDEKGWVEKTDQEVPLEDQAPCLRAVPFTLFCPAFLLPPVRLTLCTVIDLSTFLCCDSSSLADRCSLAVTSNTSEVKLLINSACWILQWNLCGRRWLTLRMPLHILALQLVELYEDLHKIHVQSLLEWKQMSPSKMVRVFAFSHSSAFTHTNAKPREEKLQSEVRKSSKLHTALLQLANQLLQATISGKPLMLQAKKCPSKASARCPGRKIKHFSTLRHPSHLIPQEKLLG